MTEEGQLLYEKALEASEELRSKLSKVRIKIQGSSHPGVIEAISKVFGKEHITATGDAYLTYDMYCSVVNLIRTLGNTVAAEKL